MSLLNRTYPNITLRKTTPKESSDSPNVSNSHQLYMMYDLSQLSTKPQKPLKAVHINPHGQWYQTLQRSAEDRHHG